MRILFYCHNVFGLGHVVRSLRIAQAALDMGIECALMTGCRFLDRLNIDPAVKIERLAPVKMAGGLFVGAEDDDGAVLAKRGRRILEFMRDWQPEAVVSDHIALGLGGELVETLLAAAEEAWPTKFVWGVRDVIRGFAGPWPATPGPWPTPNRAGSRPLPSRPTCPCPIAGATWGSSPTGLFPPGRTTGL